MARAVRVDLYCEDRGHEQFVRPLILRLARENGMNVAVHTQSGRGGHGKAIAEFSAWQRLRARRGLGEIPDLLVLTIDTNCTSWHTRHQELVELVDREVFPRAVIGCPEPHVERWCIADPASFNRVVGGPSPKDPAKCERHLYKRLLRKAILDAGQVILTDEMELAPDLVEAMDLYRAGKAQSSLKHFTDELGKELRSLALG